MIVKANDNDEVVRNISISKLEIKNFFFIINPHFFDLDYADMDSQFKLNMQQKGLSWDKKTIKFLAKLGVVSNWKQIGHDDKTFIQYWMARQREISRIYTKMVKKIHRMTECRVVDPYLENSLKITSFYLRASLALCVVKYLQNLKNSRDFVLPIRHENSQDAIEDSRPKQFVEKVEEN